MNTSRHFDAAKRDSDILREIRKSDRIAQLVIAGLLLSVVFGVILALLFFP